MSNLSGNSSLTSWLSLQLRYLWSHQMTDICSWCVSTSPFKQIYYCTIKTILPLQQMVP